MAGHSQEKNIGELQREREIKADYYGFSEEGVSDQKETNIPYKLEPNATEIEDFLTRLRQEGL